MQDIAITVANQHRKLTRAMQSLLGICTGLIADNELSDIEIRFLDTWLQDHQDVTSAWPGSVIATRVREALEDGIITEEERIYLVTTLANITGNEFAETGYASPDTPAAPPYDAEVTIEFEGRSFCFTGKFMFGTRQACHRITERLGGAPIDAVNKDLDFLVVGSLISQDWAFESYGRKIEKAAAYRDNSGAPRIISEKQWASALDNLGA